MKTWILIFCVLLFPVLQNYSIDIHVPPVEKGKELGTSADPYHSIAAALEAAERFAGREPVSILLGDGRILTYNIVLSNGLEYKSKGVALVNVPENSMAWNKGLRKGDFITEVDGQKGAGIENFLQIVDGKYAPGSGNFQLYRTQDRIEVKIYWQDISCLQISTSYQYYY